MENNNKVEIFIIDEEEDIKYSLIVEKNILYKNLKEKIILNFNKTDNIYIIFNGEIPKDEDLLIFKEGDIVFLYEKIEELKIGKKKRREESYEGLESLEINKIDERKDKKRKVKEIDAGISEDFCIKGEKYLKLEKGGKKKKKLINIHFFENEEKLENKVENEENKYLGVLRSKKDINIKLVPLSGILNLCLVKVISINLDDSEIKKIKSTEVLNIILSLKNDIEFKDNLLEDIKGVLKEKSGNNILAYSEYVNKIMTIMKIKTLLYLLTKEKQEKIKLYWNKLSKYEDINKFFEKEFLSALKNSYFDYSLISISIKDKENLMNYIENKNKCLNCEKMFLYHGTQIDPISKIITSGFLYSRKPFYGLGIYFSDMIDYIEFYCGGETYEDRRDNFGKTLSVGETFSFVASEVYYDRNKKKYIYDFNYYIDELDHFPNYEEIKKEYPDKMVEKNGIHFIRVEPENGRVISKQDIIIEEKKGKFIGREYVITEMDQIFPLFGVTLKRNEYFVIWRDPHFGDKNEYTYYLEERRNYLNQIGKMNAYFEPCTEKALEIIKRKKYNKIIIISSIGLDLSGKKFIEVARKILGFDVMVLFFSESEKHLEWIQNFPNALYTNDDKFYKKYITNYNEYGLKNLKKEIEDEYKVKLPKFSNDFLKFPKFVDKAYYSDLIFQEINDNFRKVIIKNKKNDKVLCVEKSKPNIKISFQSCNGKSSDLFLWDVTIIDNEITFYSNGIYLGVSTFNKKAFAEKYMKIWKFEIIGKKYKFFFENKKNVLTVEGNRAKVKEFEKEDNQTFELLDSY